MDSSENVSRSYTPLAFYLDSDVDYPAPILNGNNSSVDDKSKKTKNSIPLSCYTTILIYHHSPTGESKIDIFITNQPKNYKYHTLSFYMDPTISHPGLHINYIPPSSTPPSTAAVSNSSQSKVIFRCFGSRSAAAKVSKTVIPLSFFGSFGSQFSHSKVSSKNSIPDKVAFSILSKLSIKSLTRFECVRKSWSSLFEDTCFMKMYSNNFISRHGSDDDYHTFFLANHCDVDDLYHSEFHLLENRVKLNFPSPLQPSRYCTCILGSTSVNGIFCLWQECSTLRKNNSLYVLWNPLTEEFTVVPPSPAELVPMHDYSTYYDGHLLHFFNGFGYDQLRDDFKVIQYVTFECFYYPTSFIEMYSLKSNSWRMIHMDQDLFRGIHRFYGREVYVDGACHWLVSRSINDQDALTLLSFDLSDEVFLTTPIGEEPYYSPYTCDRHLQVLNGSIALISNYHDDIVFHIYILGELGVSESWIKLYMFIKKQDYEVAYVDLSTQIIKEVGAITDGPQSHFLFGLYKESLQRISN